MWIFTKHGFYSAVCAKKGEGNPSQPIDPDRLMVRARVLGHLEALKERFPDLLGTEEIHAFPDADYPYRLFVKKPIWVQVLAELAEEIDYGNFKGKIGKKEVSEGYLASLHEVWAAMRRLQK